MPSTRRRFLSGAATGVALLAGCNEPSSSGVERTVTPVDVPRTDAELLERAARIEYPSLQPAVVVTAAHHESAVGHADSLLSALERELADAADVDVSRLHRPVPGRSDDPDRLVEQTRDRLDGLREREPSLDALADVQRTIGDTALLLGFVRADRGETTRQAVLAAIEAERTTVRSVKSSIDYRLAQPVAASLPPLFVAESKLDAASSLRFARETEDASPEDASPEDASPEDASPEASDPTHIAEIRRQLAVQRRRRRDAERFLASATATDAPARTERLLAELRGVRDELDALPERFQRESARSQSRTVAEQLRDDRRHVGQRAAYWRRENGADPEAGRVVLGLVEGTRLLVQVDAVDTAVERTLDRLDGRSFPARTVPDEKRRAVERLERLVDGTALQRFLAERAVSILGFAARQHGDDGVSVETVARAHFMYALAAAWYSAAEKRGGALAQRLE